MSEAFDFLATVESVGTLPDGAIRVILDMPANSEVAAAKLMVVRRLKVVLQLTVEDAGIEYDELLMRVQQSATHGKAEADRRTARSPIDLAGS